MLAPIDAKAIVEAGDDKIVLRLNFRTIALAAAEDIDLFDPQSLNRLTTMTTAKLARCLATPDQPDFTDENGLSLTVQHGAVFTKALFDLLKSATGKAGDENPPKAGKGKPTA